MTIEGCRGTGVVATQYGIQAGSAYGLLNSIVSNNSFTNCSVAGISINTQPDNNILNAIITGNNLSIGNAAGVLTPNGTLNCIIENNHDGSTQ